jgi:hypothetical protein
MSKMQHVVPNLRLVRAELLVLEHNVNAGGVSCHVVMELPGDALILWRVLALFNGQRKREFLMWLRSEY